MLNNENLYLFKFAWRSIRRNAGRSFFIGFSVSLAVVIAVWVVAFFDGLNYQIERAVVNTNMGFFQLQEKSYAKTTDASHPLEFDPVLAQKLQQPPIRSASPELVLDGNISTPEGAAGLLVLGIEPDLHKNLIPIHHRMIKGAFLAKEDVASVIIGQELAEVFKFNPGDQLVLNYQDVNGELRSELLNIKGVYHYGSKGFEKRFIYVNQSTWQNLYFNHDSGKILFNRIPLMTTDLSSKPEVDKRFKDSGLEIKTWRNLNPEMAVVLDFHNGIINFFFLIIGVTITMTILTPVRMLWQERLKELRMMNIVGVSSKKFWKIGIFEVFQMIVLSGAFSTIMLVIVIGIQAQTGISFESISQGIAVERAGIKIPNIVYPRMSGEQLLITFLFVIFVLSFSYIYSIYRTLRKLEANI